ncbi:MAG: lactate dehydrogenase [Fimbriimonadales bacterium]|nr:MAG: lactate dehydrogenase [Fimbriimonadales bacterium]
MRLKDLHSGLSEILGKDRVLSGDAVRKVYDCDAYTLDRHPPLVITLPETTEEVSAIVRWCREHDQPFTPRGAGTGLSGGAIPACGGVVVSLSRMRRILEIDLPNRLMLAQAGCPNLSLSKAVAEHGYHFAPDPSSQTVCTLGGNIAENSGGPHTLKYGVTTDHVLGVTLVDDSGTVRTFGGRVAEAPGFDLLGLLVGSEGTLGIVTEAWVRLTPLPAAVRTVLASFDTPLDATRTVSDVIGAGIIPAAMEFMDGHVIHAVEAAFHTGLPLDAGALLLIECDGEDEAVVEREVASAVEIARTHNALDIQVAADEETRGRLWTARKKGIGALGRIAPSIVTHDGVIPRSRLPEVLEFVYEVAREAGIGVANIFHAGDGNLHPIFLFDERDPEQLEAVTRAGEAVMRRCIEEGGSVTGEHGIGIEKVDLLAEMFSETDLRWQRAVRDCFRSTDLCNPGKVFPSSKSCVEVRVRHRAVPV